MHRHELSLRLLLYRYLWPFWLFRDASRGDGYSRAAAYRHNRERRVYLPGYLIKWVFICAFALASTNGFQQLAADVEHMHLAGVLTGLAIGSALLLTVGLCLLMNISYIYLYLHRHEV